VTASAHSVPLAERSRTPVRGWTTRVARPMAEGQQRVEEITLEDGSMVVGPEIVKLLGAGDLALGRKRLRDFLYAQYQPKVFSGPTEKPARVRAAGPQDEAALLELLMLDAKENAERVAPISEARIMHHIRLGTHKNGGVVGVIDDAAGKPVALTLLVNFQWWWSEAWGFQEVVTYVHPDHRRSQNVHDLIQFQRWWVDAMTKGFGYRIYLLCGVLGVHRVMGKIALYRRYYRQAGVVCVYPSPFSEDVT
jgi:hypothetical protein